MKLQMLYRIGWMKLQLQIFVQDRVDETTATNRIVLMKLSLYMRGLMKLQLQMFVQDRVDETTATNVCIGQG